MTETRAVHTRGRTARTRRPLPVVPEVIRDGSPAAASAAGELAAAAELLAGADELVLVAHIQPDADALGSALALGLALERRGARVAVSFAEPDSVPQSLRGLPGSHLIVPPALLPEFPELFVSLDVGSAERLGSLARLLVTAQRSLVIDHHTSNTRFGQHHLIDPAAKATVVLVTRLLDRLGVTIDGDIAENLYAGLVTDTNHFRFADADSHRLAARLLEVGVDPPRVLNPITDSHPFGWFGMLASVLGKAVLDRDAARGGGLVYTVIDNATRAGLRAEELDSVIDILRTAQESGVAAVVKQNDENSWQVSLRSRGDVDVAAVAQLLGGGGHRGAAGFTHHGAPQGAIENLHRALAEPQSHR